MEAIYKHGLLWQDCQHSHLLLSLSSLNKARGTKSELSELKETIVFLEFYIKAHFDIESHYMDVLKFPDVYQHKKDHRIFEQMVAEFKVKIEVEKDSSVLVNELCEWFKDHILKSDKKLAEFIIIHTKEKKRSITGDQTENNKDEIV